MYGFVNEINVSILIDTGSAVSIISEHLWDKALKESRLRPVHTPVLAANGESLSIKGHTLASISIAGCTVRHRVLVSSNVSQECLLGADFLASHDCIVDFPNRQLKMGQENAAIMQTTKDSNEVCRVTVADTTAIKAGREELLWADVYNKHGQQVQWTGMLEPKPGSIEKYQLLVARTLSTPDSAQIPVRVINMSPCSVTLHKGTNVGEFHPLMDELAVDEFQGTHPHSYSERSSCNVVSTDNLGEELTETQQEALSSILYQFTDVFSTGKSDLGRTSELMHKIDTGDAKPIKQPLRRVPFHLKDEVGNLLTEMQQQGIIEPSQSPWASPVVLVRKKDGSIRFCIDYRKVNQVTRRDSYPLPRVDDILDSLSGAQWFTTLDLASGYWQVMVDPKDREKTAFTTNHGLYQFRVMPFGLTNAPSTFQRLMELVLAGLRWETCLAYLDDVIVFGRTFDEHLQRLSQVLSRFRQANLKVNLTKCQFFKKSVSFLGHVISHKGIETDPKKTEAVRSWPPPENIEELRSFLGLATYYRRFIRNFARIAVPLFQLLQKKEPFQWLERHADAFATLKSKLTSAPVLAYPKSEGQFYLDTDASNNAIGAVLSQSQDGVERVIAYGSRALTKSERNYCVTRRELLALVYFMQYFKCYLLGKPFTVRTDHAALKWIQSFKEPEGQIARWIEQLQQYEFSTQHRSGKVHLNADGLSRHPCRQCKLKHSTESEGKMVSALLIQGCNWALSLSPFEVRKLQITDPTISQVLKWIEKGKPSSPENLSKSLTFWWKQWQHLQVVQGVLYRQVELKSGAPIQQMIVPKGLQKDVLEFCHDSLTGGHLGIMKTQKKLEERFFWEGMNEDARQWCSRCLECAARKSPNTISRVPLISDAPAGPME